MIHADPQVAALSTLTNVQNSLFVPHLGTFVNRQPTYTISPPEGAPLEEETSATDAEEPTLSDVSKPESERPTTLDRLHTASSLTSVLDETRFAVLPQGTNLAGWTKAEAEELNDHVRHMLHSRRSKFKRAMRGFGQYVSKRKLFRWGVLPSTDTRQRWGSWSLYMHFSSLRSALHGSFSLSVGHLPAPCNS